MIGIIITAHGRLPEGISSSLQMFFEKLFNYEYVNFIEGMDLDVYANQLEDKIQDLKQTNKYILVVTDLFGGTPFNQMMILSAKYPMLTIITGLSLPVLMEAVSVREHYNDIEEMVMHLKQVYINAFRIGEKLL